MKILFSNLGYAKGIGGALWEHILRLNRQIYTLPSTQRKVLAQFRAIIDRERPDLCCLVEVDRGSFHSSYFNQMQALMCESYCFHDIADKYGEKSWISALPFHRGKSNAFMARYNYPFQRLYFQHGSKRLIYQMDISHEIRLFFAHFSLQRDVRVLQFKEMQQLVKAAGKQVIILADFNILQGFSELQPLLEQADLRLLNRENEPTFTFHKRKLALDLCLCSASLASTLQLRIIPQAFSDHAAVVVEW